MSGCALAPGMRFDDRDARVEPANGALAVSPIIKTITPQLIQQELQLATTGIHASLSEIMTPPQPYKIGAGDHLAITVWDHPELLMPVSTVSGTIATLSGTTPAGYTVSPEGKIQFPYAGDFKVEGLTELQARDLLVQRLSNYIKKPEVTLRVLSFRSKRVYVDGEVKLPGIVQIDDIPLSLPEALNRAGGITPLGDHSRITITREGKIYRVDLTRLTAEGIDPSRIMLSNGDMLRVISREESKVFVIGEVTKPVTLTLRNGRLSLNEALGEAGGVNPQTADANQIYVIRNANDTQPIIYHLDAHSPAMFALAENFELKAKDVVYVDAATMVRFNRIISLILPTAQTITIINRGFQ
ncbi:MAG: polysaccharide biosynthesis/export family protein [Gallionella sp.]|nr:polysaccharide biosynthesis/export family protein [Gallionella sp.]